MTMPAAPRISARRARMSPIVPALRSPSGRDHEHVARLDRLDRPLLGVEAGRPAGEQVLPEREVPHGAGEPDETLLGMGGTSSSRMHPAKPRLTSSDVRVAVLTLRRPAATSAP